MHNKASFAFSELDRQLLQLLSRGLPVTVEPYQWLAEQLACSEQEVILRIRHWLDAGVIKRLGTIVNHHKLGYRTNGMVVWNFADDQVENWGERFAEESAVTLCYQRPRRLPQWRFNLFTMIHGQSREEVIQKLNAIVERHQLHDAHYEILFSTRQFKQKGAKLIAADNEI